MTCPREWTQTQICNAESPPEKPAESRASSPFTSRASFHRLGHGSHFCCLKTENNCRTVQQPMLCSRSGWSKTSQSTASAEHCCLQHTKDLLIPLPREGFVKDPNVNQAKQDMTLQLGVILAKFPCTHQGAGVFKPPWELILDAQILLWNKSCVQAPGLKAANAPYSKHISILKQGILPTVPRAPWKPKASAISVFENLSVQTHSEMPEPGTNCKDWLDCLPCSLQMDALTHWTHKAPPFLQHRRQAGLVQQVSVKGHLNTTAGDTMHCWGQLYFSFIYKIKEFLSELFRKAMGAQVRSLENMCCVC